MWDALLQIADSMETVDDIAQGGSFYNKNAHLLLKKKNQYRRIGKIGQYGRSLEFSILTTENSDST